MTDSQSQTEEDTLWDNVPEDLHQRFLKSMDGESLERTGQNIYDLRSRVYQLVDDGERKEEMLHCLELVEPFTKLKTAQKHYRYLAGQVQEKDCRDAPYWIKEVREKLGAVEKGINSYHSDYEPHHILSLSNGFKNVKESLGKILKPAFYYDLLRRMNALKEAIDDKMHIDFKVEQVLRLLEELKEEGITLEENVKADVKKRLCQAMKVLRRKTDALDAEINDHPFFAKEQS